MLVVTSITMIEYRFDLSPKMKRIFIMPNKTRDKEKNTLIALTAATNSVALASIYEFHFHALGTKKCHIPNPTEARLPKVTRILTS
jgi:hypothetical protein